jgi:hypothetical protein
MGNLAEVSVISSEKDKVQPFGSTLSNKIKIVSTA